MCINRSILQCHFFITNINIDYTKQVVIIGIKLDMQSSIYKVSFKEYENICKT